MREFKSLQLLLQGYLNIDWPDDYTDVWAAVEDFVCSEPASVTSLPMEIESLLRRFRSEEELRDFFIGELASGYLPEFDGWTYRDWLIELAGRASRLPRS